MDKVKKKQLKKAVTWALLAALVAGLAAMPLLAKEKAEADGPVASVLSGTVETGSITTALHGGGTLSSEDVEDIKLPSGVKITEFLVKNGERVTEGTPLAAVDSVSVMTAITEVTDTMEYLQSEIRSAKEEKVSSTVSATAGGRVKQVFAKQGDKVQEVMLEHGALAVLSLDGLMAVKIEKKMELPTGSSVTVTFGDDTEAEGRVESNLDGTIVITVEDDSYAIGQKVIVTTDEGKRVGSGELYVHNAWSATAFSGTIKTVSAKEEAKVGSGATLFTLSDTDFKAQLEYLSSLHREYEELLQDLFRMYHSGTINAPCDGTVSGVDEDSIHLLSAEDGDYTVAPLNHSTEAEDWALVLLSSTGPKENPCDPNAADCPAQEHTRCIKACTHALTPEGCKAEKHHKDCIHFCTGGALCSATGAHKPECIESCIPEKGVCTKDAKCGYHKNQCIKSCISANPDQKCKDKKFPHYPDCIESCIEDDGTKNCLATKHKPGCIKSCEHAKLSEECKATLHHYNDCINACICSESGTQVCPASEHYTECFFYKMTYTAKVALVEQIGSSSLVVRWDASDVEYEVENIGDGWRFVGKPNFSNELLVKKGEDVAVSNPKAYKPGDVIFIVTGYRENSPEWRGVVAFSYIPSFGETQTTPGLGNLSGMMGDLSSLMGGLSGFGTTDFSAASPVEEEKLFDLEGSTLMTVTPESTVSLTITLDEQDISKVSVGQKATVKVLALSGETFEGEVVDVSNRGTNSGGSSKFTAKLRLKKTANMINGMSATASLELQTKENIPLIPVAALAQQGAKTVVFTALDKETGEPAKPVSVTLGVSDGTNVEILEGLKPGDRYYYSYYDTLELDTGVEDRFTLR